MVESLSSSYANLIADIGFTSAPDSPFGFAGPLGSVPRQGVKLHVSATPQSAEAVLRRVAPIARRAGAAWKAVVSRRDLHLLNSGSFGASQVGKFITIYPDSPSAVDWLVSSLSGSLEGLLGPRIPSDVRVDEDAPLYFRFGAFEGDVVTTPWGQSVEDSREPIRDRYPAWIEREIELTTVWASYETAVARPSRRALVFDRFVATRVLSKSPKGIVVSAIDFFGERREVVLKVGFQGGAVKDIRWDGAELRRREGVIGRRMFDAGLNVPEILVELRGENEDVALVTELVIGSHPPPKVSRGLAQRLIDAVEAAHGAGFYIGDVSHTNVVVTPQGGVAFVDLEAAGDEGTQDIEVTTPGYESPRPATPRARDAWALAALISGSDRAAHGAKRAHSFLGARGRDFDRAAQRGSSDVFSILSELVESRLSDSED